MLLSDRVCETEDVVPQRAHKKFLHVHTLFFFRENCKTLSQILELDFSTPNLKLQAV